MDAVEQLVRLGQALWQLPDPNQPAKMAQPKYNPGTGRGGNPGIKTDPERNPNIISTKPRPATSMEKSMDLVLLKKPVHKWCHICKIELSSPVVALSHYKGKNHHKNFESIKKGTGH